MKLGNYMFNNHTKLNHQEITGDYFFGTPCIYAHISSSQFQIHIPLKTHRSSNLKCALSINSELNKLQ